MSARGLCRGPGSSVASQVLTLVGGLAGEGRSWPEPCTERYWSTITSCLGPSCPTSRAPNHRLRLQDACAVARFFYLMQYLLLRPAGVGVGRQHHQGDIEEALVVRRRRRWAAWRGGAWTSSCDHAATSSAVLCRSFGVVPQLQFIDSADGVRDFLLAAGVLTDLSRLAHGHGGLRLVHSFLAYANAGRVALHGRAHARLHGEDHRQPRAVYKYWTPC